MQDILATFSCFAVSDHHGSFCQTQVELHVKPFQSCVICFLRYFCTLSFLRKFAQGNKNFCSAFGLVVDSQDITKNPTIHSFVKEYHACMDKERKMEVRRTSLKQTGKVCIGNSLNDSRVTLSGEKTPEHFKDRVTAANSIGRLTFYGDERRRILSIVAMDQPYTVLQQFFNCSSKTVAAAKVHCILSGRGGTP